MDFTSILSAGGSAMHALAGSALGLPYIAGFVGVVVAAPYLGTLLGPFLPFLGGSIAARYVLIGVAATGLYATANYQGMEAEKESVRARSAALAIEQFRKQEILAQHQTEQSTIADRELANGKVQNKTLLAEIKRLQAANAKAKGCVEPAAPNILREMLK